MKNTAFLYVRMFVVMAISLYTSRLVLQLLGVDDYGLYNVVGGIVLVFSIINSALSAGSSRFITYELGKGHSGKLCSTFSASFFIHLTVAIVVLILAETLGLWYVNTILVVPPGRLLAANCVFQFSVVTCILSLTQVPYSAAIIAHEDMGVYAWVGICEAIAKLIILLLLYFMGDVDKLIIYGFLIMLWGVSVQIFYRVYCVKSYPETRLRWVKDKKLYKEMLSFSLWDVMGSFTVQGHNQGINMMMNYFFSLSTNAAKAISYQVQSIINMFANNFLMAVKPQLIKLYAENNLEKMKKLVYESSKISYFLLLCVALPLYYESDYVLSIWLDIIPERTGVFLRLSIIYILLRSFATPVCQAVHATGNIKWMNILGGGLAIMLILPLTYLSYSLGAQPEMVFYIMIFECFLGNYVEIACLKKEIGFKILDYIKNVYFKSVMLSLPAILVCLVITTQIEMCFLRLVITTLSSISLIIILAYFWGISQEVRDEIVSVIKTRIHK